MKEHPRIRTFDRKTFSRTIFQQEAFEIRMLDSDFRIERAWTSCAEQNLSHEITRIRNEVTSRDTSEMRLLKWDCWNKLVESGPKIGPATGVRTRGSTLWRHRWQEASEFLCTTTPLLEGVEQPKISPNKSRNAFSDALLMSRFQYLIRAQRFWEVIFFTDFSTISFPIFPPFLNIRAQRSIPKR